MENNGGTEKTKIGRKALIIGAAVLSAALIGLLAYFAARGGTGNGISVADDSVPATAAAIPDITLASETAAAEFDEEEILDLLPREIPENSVIKSVTAEKRTGRYIDADTGFAIVSAEDMPAEDLKALLTVTPAVNFSLERTAERSYLLKPSEAFPEASLVNISLNDENGETAYRWAFQTVCGFKRESVYPADKSEYVSVDTGIEVKFTSAPNAKNAEGYFTVSPETKGRFEVHGRTLVFVPAAKLKNSTVYTVTVKKGMLSADGIALDEDISFKFKTYQGGRGSNYCYAANGMSETFVKGDMPVIEIYCSKELRNNTFAVNLYQYKTADDYLNAIKAYAANTGWDHDEYEFPTAGLDCVYSSEDKLTLREGNNSWQADFMLLPENLDYGYYLADLKTGAFHIQRLIQVCDISVYSSTLPTETMFFVNDAATGKTADGASITLYSGDKTFTGKVSPDGTSKITFGSEISGTGAVKIEYGGKVYADIFDCHGGTVPSPEQDYYTYIYTDREAYLTTDTIRVWGLIRPRNGRGATIPSDLKVALTYGWYGDDYGYETAVTPVPVKIGSDGTFTAEIAYSDSVESWAYVRLISDSLNGYDTKCLCYKNVDITDYVKPTYNITADAPVTAFMPQTNPVKVSVSAEYFDGTPAVGLDFSVGGSRLKKASPSLVRTDEKGYAETEVTVKDSNTWRPDYIYAGFELLGVENEYSNHYAYAHFISLYRDVMLEYEVNGSTVDITTSKASLDKFTMDDWYSYNVEDKLRGAPVDTEVTGVLHRTWYTKRETGTFYDFLLKQTFKRYEYDRHEETVGTYTISTKGGKGAFKNLPVNDKESSYRLELSWKDTQNQPVEQTIYIYDYDYYYRRENNRHYYTFSHDSTFRENQAIEFTLNDNYEEVTTNKGRLFYAFNKTEFVSSGTANGTKFSHTLTNDHVPNVSVTGAYFDGKHVFSVTDGYYDDWYYWYTGLHYDYAERELTLKVTPDKDKYAPADTANITVEATDEKGTPFGGAAVSLSIVDEAAFAIADQKADPISKIYAYVYYPDPKTRASYIQHCLDDYGGGEKGGGDGDAPLVRKDFKDSAAFLTGVTGSAGKASFTVKLPDNITTWRATAQAAGFDSRGEPYAGTEKAGLASSLKFFLTPIILDKYIEGDDICLSSKTAGAESGVDITVKVTGNGVDKTLTVSEGSFANFGKLPKGEYKALFTAKSGAEADAIELPFEVVDTILETTITKSFELNEQKLDIDPIRYPVTLSFYDKEYLFYADILRDLSGSWGNRTDFEIARAFAAKEFGYITDEEFVKRVGGITGLAKELPNSEESAEVTALICAAAPELISGSGTAECFYRITESKGASSANVSAAYMGLAALSEPVLTEILGIMENPVGFNTADRLRLCAGLALLGDSENALKYYTEITEEIKIYNNADGELNARFDNYDRTRLALITASLLKLPEAEGMARYLNNSEQREVSTVLERMVYLNNYVPKREGSAVLKYNLNGAEQTVTLKRFGRCVLKMGKEQLENANFEVVSGSVLCTACYEGRITEKDAKPTIKIEKTVSSVNGTWTPGSLVRVTLKVPFDKKYRTIDDVVPSCARYAGSADSRSWFSRSGQRISASVWEQSSVSYYIRLVAPGDYVLDSAVISENGDKWGISEKTKITVEEYEKNV